LPAVVDTRLLLTLEFPPNEETKKRAEILVEREIAHRLLAPSIVLAEFVRVAGSRIGGDAALVRIRLLKERGMRVLALGEREALAAGSLLLAHRDVPIADALIASAVKIGEAEYVVTDDPHYKTLGIRTRWM
jgi:predicted nucleic acid-binding protein